MGRGSSIRADLVDATKDLICRFLGEKEKSENKTKAVSPGLGRSRAGVGQLKSDDTFRSYLVLVSSVYDWAIPRI